MNRESRPPNNKQSFDPKDVPELKLDKRVTDAVETTKKQGKLLLYPVDPGILDPET